MTEESFGGAHRDFEKFRAALFRRFGDKTYSSWLSDLECVELTEDSVTLSTESQVTCDTLQQRFMGRLKDTWSEDVRPISRLRIVKRDRMIKDSRRVDGLKSALNGAGLNRAGANGAGLNGAGANGARAIGAGQNGRARIAEPALLRATGEARRAPGLDALASPVDERMTFAAFAVDHVNEMAFAAANQVLADGAPADLTYFNGPSGVGKSHLLSGIANEHRRRFGPGGCAYLTHNALQEGCVTAIFSNGLMALQRDLLSKDVVLIDDIHLLATSSRTQTELLNFVNAALASGKRIVVAGEMTPLKLAQAGFNERLTDRLAGGLSVALRPGDAAHRARVLKKRLEMTDADTTIDDDAISFIADKFPQSLREAIGALKQLQLFYAGKSARVGRIEAEAVLRGRLIDSRRTPSFEETAAAVAAAFDLTLDEFKSRGQYQRLVRARHAFVILCREHLHESFPSIAKFLKRDHTTVMSGYKRGHALLERDKTLQARLAAARAILGLAPG